MVKLNISYQNRSGLSWGSKDGAVHGETRLIEIGVDWFGLYMTDGSFRRYPASDEELNVIIGEKDRLFLKINEL